MIIYKATTKVLNILTNRRTLEDETKLVLVGRRMRHLTPFAFANAKYAKRTHIHYDDHEGGVNT